MFLSVVLPAYNEAENIKLTIDEIVNSIALEPRIKKYEIIVIDDHSSDGTFEVVKILSDKSIHCYRLSRRSGSHTALRAGIDRTLGDAVLCISSDGQDNPNIIGKMAEKYIEGNDTIWALRKQREESLKGRLFAIIFYKLLQILTGHKDAKIDLERADFFLLSNKVTNSIKACKETNTSLFGLIIWLGFKQDFVEYNRRPRLNGISKWNFKSRIKLAKDWIMGFSGIPLRLITYVGFMVAIIGFLYAFIIVILALAGYTKPGWAETVILVTIMGGIQMIMLGIMGEYLWRNLDEARKRPLYFIESDTFEKTYID